MASFPEPIFVGGVGRSGTHPMGRLIGSHPRYHWIPTECRFHASEGGLPDLVAGHTPLAAFLERMRGRWWVRGARRRQGMQRIASAEDYEAALEEFERGYAADPIAASRQLVRRLLDPAAERAGKPAWVEITGQVVEQAPFLLRLFPDARFVNMVRDGRAVAAGMLRKVDLTDEPLEALGKWERMVRAADAAIREAPRNRILTVPLDDFTARDRESVFARLVALLELDDPGPMREYFEREITAERANVGRWRERMPPPDARRVDRRYRRLVRRLHREGIAWVPKPERRS